MYVLQENTNQKDCILENLDLYEDFYNTFYDLNFPIFMMKKYKGKTSTGFVTGFEWIKNKVLFRYNVYLSICNKFIKNNEKGKAQNIVENTRSARFFVVDIDSDYLISQESAKKIINAFNHLGFFDYCPKPTATIASGSGFHFYYAIDEIYFPITENFRTKKEYKVWREEKESLFKDSGEVVRKAVANSLAKTIDLIKNVDYIEKKILETLKVDNAVTTQTQQVIRAPGSFNTNSESYCTILEFNSNCRYTLSQLLQDYRAKTEKIENTNIIKFRKSGIYTSQDTVKLNKKRMKDMHKLVEIRKEADTLIGSRQNLISNYAWLLINTNSNLEKTDQIDIHKELLALGRKIGGEFATESYCKNKIKHMETYHKKRSAISNEAMIKFLKITEEEIEQLTTIKLNREAQRAKKREEKRKRKEIVKTMLAKGKKNKEILTEVNISRATLFRWKKELEEK